MSLRVRPLITALLLGAVLGTAQAQDPRAAGRYLEDALKRYESRDVSGAIIQLKNALQQDKQLLPAHILLGKALLEDSNPAAAEVALQEALRLGASPSEVVVPLARALLDQGKPTVLLEDPKLSPNGLPVTRAAELHLVRAQAESDLGREREALASIAQARQLLPATTDSWAAEVPLRLRGGQFSEAQLAANKVIELEPGNAQGHYLLGSVLHVRGKMADALAAYSKALNLDPKHLEALVARAGLYIDQRQLAAAGKDLDSLRQSHPRDPRAAYLRALLAEDKGERDSALQAMREVTDLLDPVSIEFLRYRPQLLLLGALAHHSLGQLNKAQPLLETLVKQQPRSPAAKLLAQVLFSQDQVENGIVMLESYLRLQPRDSQALALLASGHSLQGRHEKAAQLLKQAMAGREALQLRTVLGQSLLRAGKFDAAQAELEQVWSRSPAQGEVGFSLVMIYLRQQQPGKALPILQNLIKARPKQANLHLAMGLVKSALGDAKAARSAYETALQLDPRMAQAQVGLARLDAKLGNLAAAKARLQALQQADENAVEPLLELASLAQMEQQWPEVERLLEKAILLARPRELRPDFTLIDFHLRRENAAKAVGRSGAEHQGPQSVPALIALARSHLANRDLASARRRCWKQAVWPALRPTSWRKSPACKWQLAILANARHPAGRSWAPMPSTSKVCC
ncbi:MAG: XrtA/PEP-CTERM system TPR-repeat protein PrsT [Inhella sp.]